MVTKTDIETGVRELGLTAGDTVIVHSSLSSFGRVQDGAETVVEALLAVIGGEGTLIVPTFNYQPEAYDPQTTPSLAGQITEAVRTHPGAVRSLHPTHSVAAIGRLAEIVTEGHERANAFGRGSALFKALQADAKILQLGVTHTSNSMIHVAEEIVGLPYLDRSRRVSMTTSRGKLIHKWVRRPGCSRGFDALDEALQERDAIRETMIGACRARLMRARDVVEAGVEMLKFDPEALLCHLPDCGTCAEARAMIAALEAERLDQESIELAKEDERTLHMIEKKLEGTRISYFDPDDYEHSPN